MFWGREIARLGDERVIEGKSCNYEVARGVMAKSLGVMRNRNLLLVKEIARDV